MKKKTEGLLLLLLSVSCEMKQQVKQAAVLQDNHHLWTKVTELLIIALHCFDLFLLGTIERKNDKLSATMIINRGTSSFFYICPEGKI